MKGHSNPSTVIQEHDRQTIQQLKRSIHQGLRRELGEVVEVADNGRNMVFAKLTTGEAVAGGRAVRVINSPKDILLRYGTLRPGLKLSIIFTGDTHKDAVVEIIGDEEDGFIGTNTLLPNIIDKSLYQLFPPGSGIL